MVGFAIHIKYCCKPVTTQYLRKNYMKKNLLLFSFVYVGLTHASVFSVINTNDGGVGSLRQAISDVNANLSSPHTINISIAGTITLGSNLPTISKSVTINGFPNGGTIISGNLLYSIFNFSGTNAGLLNVYLNDLELKEAYANLVATGDGGSAIHGNFLGYMGINRCYIHHCATTASISGNYLSVHGGAVSVQGSGVCSTNSVFYARQTTVAYNMLVANNLLGTAEAYGAGLFAQSLNDTIENCTFYGNKVVANSGASNGQATATGGGMAFYGCSILVRNSSFVSDTATATNASGTHVSGAAGLSTIKYPIRISNCLADLNVADNGPNIGSLYGGMGDIISDGYNVIGAMGGSSWAGKLATDTINAASLVQPLANNGGQIPTCAILTNSPAIDRMIAGTVLTADGRNYSRDSKPDAGAYEFNGITLPLGLLQFTAIKATGQVLLQWNTTDENNTHHFVVQSGTNGTNFTNIAIVSAIGSGSHIYSSIDAQNVEGAHYYRLQIVDRNGMVAYSNIVRLNIAVENGFILQPNPARQYFSVTNAGSIKSISLVQTDGRTIQQWKPTSSGKYFLSNIGTGMYAVKIETAEGTSIKKLLVAQ